mgnify:CR=1 FL=1
MSIACKCERCGKFYEPNQNDEACVPTIAKPVEFNAITLVYKDYKINNVAFVGFSRMDICPECAHSFTKWWTNPDAIVDRSDE